MTVRKPANAIAEQVQRLLSINSDLDVQIEQLETRKAENLTAVEALSPMAEWHEEPDPAEPIPPTETPATPPTPPTEG